MSHLYLPLQLFIPLKINSSDWFQSLFRNHLLHITRPPVTDDQVAFFTFANVFWNSKRKICQWNSLCAWLLASQKCFCVWQFPFWADDHVWENGVGCKSKPSDDMRFYGSTSQQPQYHQLSDICMIALIHTISCFLPTFQKWWFKVLFYHHWKSYPWRH